ncbi:MAG: HAMP domain-containing protein [Rhizobiales bacterium]|nr:HAMP domain-containing protein [Hyphomicrobiales bacterium]
MNDTARILPAAAPVSGRVCAHCGAESVERFCCAGCAAAYGLIGTLGLSGFYHRASLAPGALRPAPPPAPGFAAHARTTGPGQHELDLLVHGLSCGACVWLIEQALAADPAVRRARVSLSTRRLTVAWQGEAAHADDLASLVARLGFAVGPWTAACLRASDETERRSLILALVMLGLIIFAARRVTRPLKALAASAEAFGRGDAVAPLPESGPDEARRLIHAFNQMQERLSRFVTDRTRMLAAIGHDLRTPITSLKLRAEMVDDEETRQKMRATLDEMQHMTEATLAFARDDAGAEPSRAVDLAALIESAVDDLAEMGKPVSFADAGRLVYSCRPTALKRAIGNLIENAIQYGERARVRLTAAPSGPVIAVEDDGPGIPAERIDEVFKPFTRLESSRSRETGGSGLGLSIARSIVLAHGGTLALRNREDGGLAAEIRLPPG